jgi:transcriptional regulator with XRE-family HTH domain
MSFEMKTDGDVVVALGQQFDKLRRHKRLQDKDILAASGTSSSVLAKFRSGKGNITLETFVKLIRAIGELDKLEKLLVMPQQYSPTEQTTALPERIHKPKATETNFAWGEDQ